MKGWLRYCFSTPTHTSATATIVIAVVTTVYAVVSYLQWRALTGANDINAQNIYEIQRPFISVLNIEGTPIYASGHLTGTAFNPHIENSGSTPAAQFLLYINYYRVKDPMPSDYSFPDLDEVIIYPAVGAPKSVVRTTDKTFTTADLAELQRRDRYLYIYGRAQNKDRFKNTPTHYSLFFFQLSTFIGPDISSLRPPATPNDIVEMLRFYWPTCRRHNCTDDECRE